MDYSYYGLFVPSVKYSHNINCWCEGLPPGAHPTGCLSNASRPRCSCGVLLLTTSFDEISNASWSLTAAVSFAADIHKSSFDQASIVMASQRCLAVVSAAPTSTALPRSWLLNKLPATCGYWSTASNFNANITSIHVYNANSETYRHTHRPIHSP